VLDASTSSTDGFLWRDRYVLNSPEQVYIKQTEPISTLKHLRCRKFSIQKLTQFSQGNNVLHAAASNPDGFLGRDTCVTSTQPNRPVLNKMSISPYRKP
jgi:hypothetical protein